MVREVVFYSYLQAKPFLNGLDALTRDISLTDKLFQECNITFRHWKSATITGSKGKGSTAVMLASILAANGETVGLITSPSLRRFNERIRINGRCVTDEDLEEAANAIAPAVRKIASGLTPPHYLGPTGVILALAATIFRKHHITAVVVEAGRGGEFDESRLVAAQVSLITPIMLKHAAKIGPHLSDIARTKTLITTPGSTILTAVQKPVVAKVITEVAKQFGSPLLTVGKDIRVLHQESTIHGTTCDLQLAHASYQQLSLSLSGSYQADNAALAILAAQELGCTTESIYQGVSRVTWPGRCQLLQKKPWVLLDGTINKASAKALVSLIKTFPGKSISAVVAIHNPKDLAGVCSVLKNIVDTLILTEIHETGLAWDKQTLVKIGSDSFAHVEYFSDVKDAFAFATKQAKQEDGILLLGHQSFVGAALSFWDKDTCRLW